MKMERTHSNSGKITGEGIKRTIVFDQMISIVPYSVTNDKAQKALCELARIYLTPAPTSTDVERLFSTAGGEY